MKWNLPTLVKWLWSHWILCGVWVSSAMPGGFPGAEIPSSEFRRLRVRDQGPAWGSWWGPGPLAVFLCGGEGKCTPEGLLLQGTDSVTRMPSSSPCLTLVTSRGPVSVSWHPHLGVRASTCESRGTQSPVWNRGWWVAQDTKLVTSVQFLCGVANSTCWWRLPGEQRRARHTVLHTAASG